MRADGGLDQGDGDSRRDVTRFRISLESVMAKTGGPIRSGEVRKEVENSSQSFDF